MAIVLSFCWSTLISHLFIFCGVLLSHFLSKLCRNCDKLTLLTSLSFCLLRRDWSVGVYTSSVGGGTETARDPAATAFARAGTPTGNREKTLALLYPLNPVPPPPTCFCADPYLSVILLASFHACRITIVLFSFEVLKLSAVFVLFLLVLVKYMRMNTI